MDKVKEFLELVKNDPKGKELAEKLGRPKNDTETVEGYLRIAKELNFDINEAELVQGLKNLMREKKAQSDETAERVGLSEEDLENVAGGVLCDSTYNPDGEWCWFSDSCAVIITIYSDGAYYYEEGKTTEGRDSYFDPQEGDPDYECKNLADWDIIDNA